MLLDGLRQHLEQRSAWITNPLLLSSAAKGLARESASQNIVGRDKMYKIMHVSFVVRFLEAHPIDKRRIWIDVVCPKSFQSKLVRRDAESAYAGKEFDCCLQI